MKSVKQLVFEFKQKLYLKALAKNGFNRLKTARELNTSRGDIHKHVGTTNIQAKKLAQVLFGADIYD